MTQTGKPAFWMAGLFMVVFTADIIAGAFFRAAYLSDVMGALVLAISCSFFVVGILSIENRGTGGETTTIEKEEQTR